MGSALHDAESLMNAIIGVVVAPQLWKWRRVATGAVDLYAIPQQWNPKCSGCIQPQERERVDAMVLDSMKQIFEEADADQSGKLDQDELRASFCNGRVRDRLRLLHIPFKDFVEVVRSAVSLWSSFGI
eukprot:g3437.t1